MFYLMTFTNSCLIVYLDKPVIEYSFGTVKGSLCLLCGGESQQGTACISFKIYLKQTV